jgi:LemA protein
MKVGLLILAVILGLALLIGVNAASVNNQLVEKREAVTAAWGNVDVSLQRRADLIPNLVETVKGFASQEKQVIDSVTSARAQLAGARTPQEKIAANQQIDSALARLLVVVENYPQLKSNENFMRLQDELAGTENRIAVERRKYNETVQTYNTAIGKFPSNFYAGMLGFKRVDEYFKIAPGAQNAPQVKFAR